MDYAPAKQRSREERARIGAQHADADSPYSVEVRASATHSNLVLHNKQTGAATVISFWAGDDAEMEIMHDIAGGGAVTVAGSTALVIAGAALKNLLLTSAAGYGMLAGLAGLALKVAATPYDSQWKDPHIDERYAGVRIPLSQEQYETMRLDAAQLKQNPPAYNPLDSASVWRAMPILGAEKLGGENCLGVIERLFDGIGLPFYPTIGMTKLARHIFLPVLLAEHLKSQADANPTRKGMAFYRFGVNGKPVVSPPG